MAFKIASLLCSVCLFQIILLVSANSKRDSQDIGTFVQISDLHYDYRYEVGAWAQCIQSVVGLPCCHSGDIHIPEEKRQAGKYGDYSCDSPLVLLNDTFEWIANMQPTPDFILWTGDEVDHDDFVQTASSNLNEITVVSLLYNTFLPKMQVYPVLGNHDTWPIDQMEVPPLYSWLLDVIGDLWDHWLPTEAQETLTYAGYYTTVITPGLRIIVLNTLFYDRINKIVTGSDPGGQWAWLTSVLENATTAGEKVWIAAHVYPGNGEATEFFTDNFESIVDQYQDTVIALFFGHSHKDQFGLMQSASGKTTLVNYIAPSVTPQSVMNPSVRVYYYNRTTFEVIDYDQYNTDLTVANLNEYLSYELSYTATKFYGIPDVSSTSFQKVVDSYFSNYTLFSDWYNIVYNGKAPDTSCSDTGCQVEIMCALAYTNSTTYQNCADTFKW